MKFQDLYDQAVAWSCYLENFPDPGRYLGLYGLSDQDATRFDCLGRFFPFRHYYARPDDCAGPRVVHDLGACNERFVLPWIYWPTGSNDFIHGKSIIAPPAAIFNFLDNKVNAKRLFQSLKIPTPSWGCLREGMPMVEKPIENSAGGIGIRLTSQAAREGYFLERYLPGYRSIGVQLFVLEATEFICADLMLIDDSQGPSFTFHSQRNMSEEELPPALIEDLYRLGNHLKREGYRGFLGVDALVSDDDYHVLEVNPRGIAFLPGFFAARALGWKEFETRTTREPPEEDEIVLLDFGIRKKVIKNRK